MIGIFKKKEKKEKKVKAKIVKLDHGQYVVVLKSNGHAVGIEVGGNAVGIEVGKVDPMYNWYCWSTRKYWLTNCAVSTIEDAEDLYNMYNEWYWKNDEITRSVGATVKVFK
jgi:hypothetical protein